MREAVLLDDLLALRTLTTTRAACYGQKTFTIFTVRKRSLGQGNVFTPVYHSVHIGGLHPGGRGFCIPVGLHPGGCAEPAPPPDRILRDTVNERAVCILLECILVFVFLILVDKRV